MFNQKVSIIVPVYNAEEFLEKCVKSILNQTYRNIEIILINDGSTDNSGKICEQFSIVDKRIKTIHKENSGPSSVRNLGIEKAAGQYIQFVDADDVIDSTMTEKLVKGANGQSQLVICGVKTLGIDSKGNVVTREKIPPIEGNFNCNEFLQFFGDFYTNSLINSPCNKLYQTEIIKKYKIRFDKNLYMGEDLLFNINYINVCSSVSVINEPLYYYLKYNNENSLTKNYKVNSFYNQKMIHKEIKDMLIEKDVYTEKNQSIIERSFILNLSSHFENLFHKNSILTADLRKKEIKNIVSDEWIRTNILYLKKSNIQSRFVGILIKCKSIFGIYCFYKLKGFLRNNMSEVFTALKSINNNREIEKISDKG